MRNAAAASRTCGCPSTGSTRATRGRPRVRVPVLSKATAVRLAGSSRNEPPLTSTPLRAALVSPATMDTGVEMTSAHGQAMTSTTSASYTQADHAPPKNSGGATATSAATASMAGVYTAAKRSTHCTARARRDWAASTMCRMRARVVSEAARVVSTSSTPPPLMVPAYTGSPTRLGTGMDSPVMGDWSMSELPAATVPSRGMRSPARMRMREPTGTFSTAVSTGRPGRPPPTVPPTSPGRDSSRAREGEMSSSAAMAERARSTLHDSSWLATANRNATEAPSKNWPMAAAPMTAVTISRFMSGRRLRTECTARGSTRQAPATAAASHRIRVAACGTPVSAKTASSEPLRAHSTPMPAARATPLNAHSSSEDWRCHNAVRPGGSRDSRPEGTSPGAGTAHAPPQHEHPARAGICAGRGAMA